MQKWLYRIWIVSLATFIVQVAFYYNDLPDKMATHFDALGNPDGWSDKSEFITLMLVIILMLNVWPIITRKLFNKIPKALFNIPNREYWFTTEKRNKYMHSIVCAMMDGIFGGTNLLFIILMRYTYDVNVTGTSGMNMWLGVTVMLPLVLISVFWGIIKLSNTTFDDNEF